MIDSKTIKPLNGWVLVVPHGDYETIQKSGRDTGLLVSNLEYQKNNNGGDMIINRKEKHYSTKGKVIAVPENCGWVTDKIKKEHEKLRSIDNMIYDIHPGSKINALDKAKVMFNVPMEAEIGDTVLYSYAIHLDDNTPKFQTEHGEAIFIKYDRLIASITDDGDVVKTFNGYVFVRSVNYDNNESNGIVVFNGQKEISSKQKRLMVVQCVNKGCIVEGYHDYPGVVDEDIPLEEGDYLIIDPRLKKNVEPVYHQSLKEPLYMINRRSIKMYQYEMDQMGITYKDVVIDRSLNKML